MVKKFIKFILSLLFRIPSYLTRGSDSLFGKYRVIYSDGSKSQRMGYSSAKAFQEIFGGEIIFDFWNANE